MNIDQITIRNFRVYYGANQIMLSGNDDKNITVISGNNGFGKTSFLTALVWGLYGKLMTDVDTRYRAEIYESGGYKAYCKKLMNRLAEDDALNGGNNLFKNDQDDPASEKLSGSFSISITLSNILIPSIACNAVEVTRTYDTKSQTENVEILIDGKPNELTKQVGADIFINDFILPKEIAKFFFFDAEKIVSLAEIKNADEQLYLSQAYAEVLGIKKYTDLRANLLNTRLRLREKSAHKSDRDKLENYQKQLLQNEKLLAQHKTAIQENTDQLILKRSESDNLQIQLIREGSNLTVEEITKLKERQSKLIVELGTIRYQFNDLLELAPFAIAGNKMNAVKQQLENEYQNSSSSASLMEQKFNQIKLSLEHGRDIISLGSKNEDAVVSMIKDILLPPQVEGHKVLLDYTTEQHNRFNAIYDNLKDAYSKTFRKLVSDQRNLQVSLQTIHRKLNDAESKEQDVVIQAVRASKQKTDLEIAKLEEENTSNDAKVYALQSENQVISRQLSEVVKKVKMEDVDVEKDKVAERLIDQLDKFIHQLKLKKKESLERNLTMELNRLMHKAFVAEVKVIVEGDLIDLELYDGQGRKINKELLSKGEQQLYATALLKALVEESNIKFPIFIDSPLQKFDKTHSRNIIQEFYPNINSQLILFPLLENELNEAEYNLLLPKVGKAYLIQQKEKYHSGFTETSPAALFNTYQEAYAH